MQAPDILPLIPDDFTIYAEPFVGGGSILFALKPEHAVVGDANTELMNFYQFVKHEPAELLAILESWSIDRETYHEIRAWDREPDYMERPGVERAARFAYLSRTAWNGIWRMNRKGYFNSSYGAEYPGRKKIDHILKEEDVMAVSEYMNEADLQLYTGDFEHILSTLSRGAFAFLDPPYVPKRGSQDHTAYTANDFLLEDHRRLKRMCDVLTERGVRFLQMNSGTDIVRDLYKDYGIIETSIYRTFGCNKRTRHSVTDLIIKNY